jgi:hypothetical protein
MLSVIQPANMPIHGEKTWQTGECANGVYVYANVGDTVAGLDCVEIAWLSLSRDSSCPHACITPRKNIEALPPAYFTKTEPDAARAFKSLMGLQLA